MSHSSASQRIHDSHNTVFVGRLFPHTAAYTGDHIFSRRSDISLIGIQILFPCWCHDFFGMHMLYCMSFFGIIWGNMLFRIFRIFLISRYCFSRPAGIVSFCRSWNNTFCFLFRLQNSPYKIYISRDTLSNILQSGQLPDICWIGYGCLLWLHILVRPSQ